VMGAVSHWHPESPEDATREVTVGTIAERLGIDPSRASRLVSDVVDKGYIRRAASQSDSRRIVLEATEKGWQFGEDFRRRKGEMLSRALKTWTEEELVLFSRLIDRYSRWGRDGLKPESSEKTSYCGLARLRLRGNSEPHRRSTRRRRHQPYGLPRSARGAEVRARPQHDSASDWQTGSRPAP